MKRVRVYKEIISDENLRLAIQEVNAGHRRNGNHSLNKKVIEIENNMDEYVEKLRAFIQGLVDGDEHMHPPIKRRRWDRNADSGKGKWRDINEPLLWPDQYVHHAVVQPMIPHIMRSMDRYCIASVPGRGNSYGVKALKKWMKNDVEGTKYCCECDIYHCFEELDPPYVIEALKRVFKDTETLWLCDAIMEYGVLIGCILLRMVSPFDTPALRSDDPSKAVWRITLSAADGQLHDLRFQQAKAEEAAGGYQEVACRDRNEDQR